jgi:hypothetical protein
MIQGGWVATVDDYARAGIDSDDVAEMLRVTMQAALLKWHEDHPGVLVTEPDVS